MMTDEEDDESGGRIGYLAEDKEPTSGEKIEEILKEKLDSH